ncbi:MAG: hypothetical protein ABI615_01335 [Chthoniobacterales bacterium]
MKPVPFWLWLNVLGLDAPLIAVLWQNAFAVAFGISLQPPMRIGLFCAVWVIYLGDRLLDGMRLNITSSSAARHQVAARYPFLIISLIIVALGGVLYAALRVPPNLIIICLTIAISTGLYFLWNHAARGTFSRKYFKEFIICVIFLLGVLIAPITQGASNYAAFFPAAALFFLLCLSNCALISRIERDIDIARGEESYAIHFARDLKPARWISAIVILITLVMIISKSLPLSLSSPLILSAIGLWSTVIIERIFSSRFAVVWADLCLMSPVLLLGFHDLFHITS